MDMAKRALNFSPLIQTFLTVVSIMPFGDKILNTQTCAKIVFKDTFNLIEYAQGVVDFKRKQTSSRKVTDTIFNY